MTTHYRLKHIDMSTLLKLAMQMINNQRPWGIVTSLANEYMVSRKFLYQLEHKAEYALTTALSAHAPGPRRS